MYSTSSDRCFGSRNSCPSSSVNSCNHYNDVSIVCSKYTLTQVAEIFWAYILHFLCKTTNFHVPYKTIYWQEINIGDWQFFRKFANIKSTNN